MSFFFSLAFWFHVLLALFLFLCVVLILLVLIQKGRGGGLSSAFGGGSSGSTAFGSKTGDVLTWATSIVFGAFIVMAVILNLLAKPLDEKSRSKGDSTLQQVPTGQGTPAGQGTPRTPR